MWFFFFFLLYVAKATLLVLCLRHLFVSTAQARQLQQLAFSLAVRLPRSPFTYPCRDFVHSIAFLVLFRVRDSVKPSKVSFVPLRDHSDRANIATNSRLAERRYSFPGNRDNWRRAPPCGGETT